jgi:broad specificity phosphatase PhoE
MASHGDLSPELKKLREKHQHFYLSVYTQTDALANHYVCGGGLDLGLNEQGIEDARKLAKRFQKNPLKVKRIISGPELRVIQLADFFHDEMKGKMLIFSEFGDQVMGDLEGKVLGPNADMRNPPRGESYVDFSVRVHNGLVRVLQEKDLCLVATHPRVAQKIFEWIGLEEEKVEAGVLYSIDLPVGTGNAHYRQV